MFKKSTLLLAGIASFCYSSFMMASTLDVSPIKVDINAKQKITEVTVTNKGGEPVMLQTQSLKWTKDAKGQDVYNKTSELVSTPPSFTLQANEARKIRLGLRAPIATDKELTYRLFVQEVPPKTKAAKEKGEVVNMVLRIGIPVFVAPKHINQQLQWQGTLSGKNLQLTALNSGNVHANVQKITIYAANNQVIAEQAMGGRLLVGDSHQWTVKLNKAVSKGTLLIKAQTDKGVINGAVNL